MLGDKSIIWLKLVKMCYVDKNWVNYFGSVF